MGIQKSKFPKNTVKKTVKNKITKAKAIENKEVGLYLITLSEKAAGIVKEGYVFKIGSTKTSIRARIDTYNRSLPFNPIRPLDSYILPSKIKPENVKDVEKEVRKRVKKSLAGLKVKDYLSANQREWFIIADSDFNDDKEYKLKKVVAKAVDDTVASIAKASKID